MNTETIEIARIRLDGQTQNREYMDNHVIEDYARAMKHNGATTVEAIVSVGSLADAQWRSMGVNAAHGLRRSHSDKAKAVKAAIQHPKSAGLSMREIARHTGVDHKTVAKYWDELRFSGENPHDPPPPKPAWLSEIDKIAEDDRPRDRADQRLGNGRLIDIGDNRTPDCHLIIRIELDELPGVSFGRRKPRKRWIGAF